jgi:predicted phage baseplate assembly protein
MPKPTPGNPNPVVSLSNEETMDHALYIALLAPKNVLPQSVRDVIARKTLSIGVVPALTENVPSLKPQRRTTARSALPDLRFDRADVSGSLARASYKPLTVTQQPEVLSEVGVVQVELPDNDGLQTWTFTEPLQEGTGDFPPRLEDEEVRKRLVTWLRVLVPKQPSSTGPSTGSGSAGDSTLPSISVEGSQNGMLDARLSWVGINAARVTQSVPVVNELLGAAPGAVNLSAAEADQVVKLANTPVIPASVKLEIQNINFEWELWQQTDDLLSANETDQVFSLDPESGLIRFGDGINGARPQPGRRIRASYKYGGGTQGNVAIGAIKTSPLPELQSGYKIENPIPTWGGDVGETVEEGEKSIPLYLRHRDRLVTSLDFADITRRAPGVDVGRVEVLPLFHPDRPADAAAGVVTVMVVPAFDAVRPRWPSPNRLFLKTICEYLDPRRLVTTEIFVRGPSYVSVYLSVGIEVRGGYFRDKVKDAVRDRMNEYLSELPTGGPDAEGWPLTKRLMKKDLEAVIARVAGVEFVVSMELGVAATLGPDDYPLSGLELPMLVALSVVEGEAEPLSSIVGAPTEEPPGSRIVPVPVTKSKC